MRPPVERYMHTIEDFAYPLRAANESSVHSYSEVHDEGDLKILSESRGWNKVRNKRVTVPNLCRRPMTIRSAFRDVDTGRTPRPERWSHVPDGQSKLSWSVKYVCFFFGCLCPLVTFSSVLLDFV